MNQIKFERTRTSTCIVMYSLYLYFLGQSLRNTSKALIIFRDETIIQIGNQHSWLWFCIEPIYFSVLGIFISEDRNMLGAEKITRSLVTKYGKHTIYADGGIWYDQACNVIGLKHYLHSSIEKSLMERVNQCLKDRIESFDDYYSCIKEEEYNLIHVHNWIQFFVSMYNDTIANKSNCELDNEVNIILN